MKLSKKIGSALLAGVMSLSLAVPAFATNQTLQVESSIQLPTINVVMPTTAAIVLNPYKMTVTVDAKNNVTAADQIVSQEMYVKNMSNLDLQVGVQIQGTHGKGDAKFATASATSASNTNKEAYIYAKFEICAPNAKIADPGTDTGTGIALLAEGATAGANEDLKDVNGFETAAGTVATATNTLKGTKLNATTNRQDVHPTKGTLGIKFFGDISPVTTWTDKDTLAATMSFKFTPVANIPATLTGLTDLTLSGTAAQTLTANFNPGNTELTVTSWAWESSDPSVATATMDNTDNNKCSVAGVLTDGTTAVIKVTATLSDGSTLVASCTATTGT